MIDTIIYNTSVGTHLGVKSYPKMTAGDQISQPDGNLYVVETVLIKDSKQYLFVKFHGVANMEFLKSIS